MKLRQLCLIVLCFWCFNLKPEQAETYTPYGLKNNMPLFYRKAKEAITFSMAWEHQGNAKQLQQKKRFTKWKKQARQVLFDCMGPLPPPAGDFDALVLAGEQREGHEGGRPYLAQKILLNITSFERIPAYLLIPEGEGPFPAVVMLHDHGAKFSIGKEKMVKPIHPSEDLEKECNQWSVQCYDSIYTGDYFASQGYVVLAIDALFWSERGSVEGHDYNRQQALASNMFQLGRTWCGHITNDDIQSVEFLCSLPYVDTERIAALGFSMGAHRAWMLAAASDKVSAAVAVCWMNTTEHLMTLDNNQNKGGSAYSMLLPEIRNYLDYPHVASIACPKPMYFINGSRDKLFPVQGCLDAFETMRRVWESRGAGDCLRTEIWDSPHFFSRAMHEQSLQFLNKFLRKR